MDERPIYDNIAIHTIPASTGSSQDINRRSQKTPQEPITSGMPEQKNGCLRWVTVAMGLLCISLMLLTTGLCVKHIFERKQLKSEQDQLKSERDQFMTERDQLKSERDKLETERDQLKSQRDHLEAERDQLKSERDQLETEQDQLKTERDQLKSERDQLETEQDQLKTERDQLKSKWSKVTKERDQLLSRVPCPSGWNSLCKCYQIFSPERSWYYARKACQEMGADLVTIESKEEQVYINGLTGWGWIGLQRLGAAWTWVNGRALSTGPLFWEPGQPNGDTENCVMSSFSTQNPTSNWHDYPCNMNFPFFCEKSAN